MVTRIQYYEFIKKMQASECKSASAMNAADMRAYAIKLGYVQANGIATKALKARAKKPVKPVAKAKVEVKKVVKPVKVEKSLIERKKDLFTEWKNIIIEVSDSEAVANAKNAKKKAILEKRRTLV